jgi:hypothetical protein
VTINANGNIGIVLGANQMVFVDDVSISGASFGIFASGTGANLTVRNSTFADGTTGIRSGDAGQTLFIENNQFVNLNTGIVISDNSAGVTSANLTAIDNTFSGVFGGYLFSFLPGSTGNVDATSASLGICTRDITTTLVGAIEFEGGATAEATTCAIP